MDTQDRIGIGALAIIAVLFAVVFVMALRESEEKQKRVKACRETAIRATCLHPEEKAAILDVCR